MCLKGLLPLVSLIGALNAVVVISSPEILPETLTYAHPDFTSSDPNGPMPNLEKVIVDKTTIAPITTTTTTPTRASRHIPILDENNSEEEEKRRFQKRIRYLKKRPLGKPKNTTLTKEDSATKNATQADEDKDNEDNEESTEFRMTDERDYSWSSESRETESEETLLDKKRVKDSLEEDDESSSSESAETETNREREKVLVKEKAKKQREESEDERSSDSEETENEKMLNKDKKQNKEDDLEDEGSSESTEDDAVKKMVLDEERVEKKLERYGDKESSESAEKKTNKKISKENERAEKKHEDNKDDESSESTETEKDKKLALDEERVEKKLRKHEDKESAESTEKNTNKKISKEKERAEKKHEENKDDESSESTDTQNTEDNKIVLEKERVKEKIETEKRDEDLKKVEANIHSTPTKSDESESSEFSITDAELHKELGIIDELKEKNNADSRFATSSVEEEDRWGMSPPGMAPDIHSLMKSLDQQGKIKHILHERLHAAKKQIASTGVVDEFEKTEDEKTIWDRVAAVGFKTPVEDGPSEFGLSSKEWLGKDEEEKKERQNSKEKKIGENEDTEEKSERKEANKIEEGAEKREDMKKKLNLQKLVALMSNEQKQTTNKDGIKIQSTGNGPTRTFTRQPPLRPVTLRKISHDENMEKITAKHRGSENDKRRNSTIHEGGTEKMKNRNGKKKLQTTKIGESAEAKKTQTEKNEEIVKEQETQTEEMLESTGSRETHSKSQTKDRDIQNHEENTEKEKLSEMVSDLKKTENNTTTGEISHDANAKKFSEGQVIKKVIKRLHGVRNEEESAIHDGGDILPPFAFNEDGNGEEIEYIEYEYIEDNAVSPENVETQENVERIAEKEVADTLAETENENDAAAVVEKQKTGLGEGFVKQTESKMEHEETVQEINKLISHVIQMPKSSTKEEKKKDLMFKVGKNFIPINLFFNSKQQLEMGLRPPTAAEEKEIYSRPHAVRMETLPAVKPRAMAGPMVGDKTVNKIKVDVVLPDNETATVASTTRVSETTTVAQTTRLPTTERVPEMKSVKVVGSNEGQEENERVHALSSSVSLHGVHVPGFSNEVFTGEIIGKDPILIDVKPPTILPQTTPMPRTDDFLVVKDNQTKIDNTNDQKIITGQVLSMLGKPLDVSAAVSTTHHLLPSAPLQLIPQVAHLNRGRVVVSKRRVKQRSSGKFGKVRPGIRRLRNGHVKVRDNVIDKNNKVNHNNFRRVRRRRRLLKNSKRQVRAHGATTAFNKVVKANDVAAAEESFARAVLENEAKTRKQNNKPKRRVIIRKLGSKQTIQDHRGYAKYQ